MHVRLTAPRQSAFGAIAGLGVALCLCACERPKAPVNGIGGYELAKTTLGSVEGKANGRCFDSQGRTNCMIIARSTIAKRTPQIQLEFAGTEPNALLRRIFLDIPGCNLDEIREWFEERMGKASHKSEEGALWQQKYIVLSMLSSGPARCTVTAADPSDLPRVELLLKAHGLGSDDADDVDTAGDADKASGADKADDVDKAGGAPAPGA